MKTYRILGKRGRITVPYEIRCKVGFKQNDVLSFEESADGRTVVIKREITIFKLTLKKRVFTNLPLTLKR